VLEADAKIIGIRIASPIVAKLPSQAPDLVQLGLPRCAAELGHCDWSTPAKPCDVELVS